MNRIIVVALFCIFASTLAQEIVPTFGVEKSTFYANGTLEFTCTAVGAVPTTFVPNATLYTGADYATAVGSYNGTFYHNDGSFTRTIRTINSTDVTGSISNFLAAALRNNGTGTFDRIQFITRYSSTGGVATVACATADEVQSVPYTSVYGFYRSGTPTVPTPSATLKVALRAVGTLNVDCSTGTVSGIDSIMYTIPTSGAPEQAGTYNGTFIANDGSFTRASSPQSVNTNSGASLTYFVATALNTAGTGTLNGLSNLTRYDTVGGVCPAGTTTGTLNVPFEASYGFYTTPATSTSSTSTNTQSTAPRNSASSVFLSIGLICSSVVLLMA